jgi:hypothetical protein
LKYTQEESEKSAQFGVELFFKQPFTKPTTATKEIKACFFMKLKGPSRHRILTARDLNRQLKSQVGE